MTSTRRPGHLAPPTRTGGGQGPPAGRAPVVPPPPRAPRPRPRTRGWAVVALLTALGALVVGGTLVLQALADRLAGAADASTGLTVVPAAPGPTTPALSTVGFDAGDIISDRVFFDDTTMDEGAIASFIRRWNAGCREGVDGTPCLADFTEDTGTRAPDAWCPGGFRGASADTAASIIWKAARGCGVNPQVLLTVLQKEQGLVTASGPGLSATRYRTAMGYACPDTSRCDPAWFGFSRQVWGAARQFRIYEGDPARYRFVPGRTSDVRFGPDAACGSGPVRIANQATAGLYAYTPYQPDAAALAGVGDRCSSWGNLNFYAYFTAWFGSTH